MPVVWLLCPDAGLRERLQQCLRDGEGLEVRLKPCACDAVVVAEPVFTPAQVETLQAYVEMGSVRGAAKRRCCSEQTVRRHLENARRRVGAQNVAQLVYIACALGVLNAVSSTNWVQKWQNLGIDAVGGRCRIRVEYLKGRRFNEVKRLATVLSKWLACAWVAGCVLLSAEAQSPCNQPLPLCQEECTVTVFPPPIGRQASKVVPTHRVYGPGTQLYKCGERLAYQGKPWCDGTPTHRFDVLIQGCRNEPLTKGPSNPDQ